MSTQPTRHSANLKAELALEVLKGNREQEMGSGYNARYKVRNHVTTKPSLMENARCTFRHKSFSRIGRGMPTGQGED